MRKKTKVKINYVYATYKFRKSEQDPVVDRIRTAFDDAGTSVARVAKDSLVSASTIKNWLDGTTRRPQHATAVAVMMALGYGLPWEGQRPKRVKAPSVDPILAQVEAA